MSTKNQLQLVKEETLNSVQNRIAQLQEGGFKFPKNYSPENALQSAWLILQDVKTRDNKPVLQACSRNSVAMALFKMVQLGLNPAKNQCYFIPYGDTLNMTTSYFGEVLIGKRAGLQDVKANVILEGDEFNFTVEMDGRKVVTEHKQSFANLGNKVIGAYCVITFPDGAVDTDIMTIDEIKKSWMQGATKGNSPAHKNFEAEMAKRTVINRAIKMFVNSSDDGAILEDSPAMSPTEAYVKHEIESNAHKKELSMDEPMEVESTTEEDAEAENQRMYEEAMAEEAKTKPDPGF